MAGQGAGPDRLRLRSCLASIFLTAVGSVFLALSLPPFNLEILAWFAVAGLLWAACRCHPIRAFELGLFCGVVCGAAQVGWPSGMASVTAFVPFLWLTLMLAVVAAGAALFWQRTVVGNRGLCWMALVACLGVSVEWLTTFSPLPIHMALSQYQSPFLPLVSFTGIWGVSFLVWWSNAALAAAFLQKQWVKPLTATALLLAFAILLSMAGRAQNRAATASTGRLRVAAIQNGDGTASRATLTRLAASEGARLVVWPEACLGKRFSPTRPGDPTVQLARQLQIALVPGYYAPSGTKWFNCAAWVSAKGEVEGVHRKIHLFGNERGVVVPGREVRAFKTMTGKVGLEICFDSCFPTVTRRLVMDGAQIVALPNHDPLVARGILHSLHAAFLPFRAAENGVPFVRSDAGGASQVVDADGHIIAQSPLFQVTLAAGEVHLGNGKGTFFTRFGDWLAYLCLAVVLSWIGVGFRSRHKPSVFERST